MSIIDKIDKIEELVKNIEINNKTVSSDLKILQNLIKEAKKSSDIKKKSTKKSDPESNGVINNDLYDKLLGIMEHKEEKQPKKDEKSEKVLKKRGTRKHTDNPKPKNRKKSRKSKPSPV
jgi:hypothetical protein